MHVKLYLLRIFDNTFLFHFKARRLEVHNLAPSQKALFLPFTCGFSFFESLVLF
jgi:hypothetical protein